MGAGAVLGPVSPEHRHSKGPAQAEHVLCLQYTWYLFGLLSIAVFCWALSGCGGGDARPRCDVDLDAQGWAQATGRPRDINASLGGALTPVGFAVLERFDDESGRLELDLINARGERGRVEIVVDEPLEENADRAEAIAYQRAPQIIRVRASLTRFGNPESEREIVCAIVRRLEALDDAGNRPVPR